MSIRWADTGARQAGYEDAFTPPRSRPSGARPLAALTLTVGLGCLYIAGHVLAWVVTS